MSDFPALEGPALPPTSGGKPQQIVLLLHGLGADGNDLIGLAPYFAQALPDALFVSPHAPFACDMAPTGRQWFSLQDQSMPAMFEGVRRAAPILEAFIDNLLEAHGLTEDRLAYVGFSQGTMMSLHVATRRHDSCAAVVGYSGLLVGAEELATEITARPPVLLVHGDADPVVPVEALPMSQKALETAGVVVESEVRPGLPHSIDEDGIRLGMTFLQGAFT